MQANSTFRCPICEGTSFDELGRRTYAKSEMASLDDYTNRRYRVLFEVWYPDSDAVELTCCHCHDCGFVTNNPRPGADDVNRKYLFLNSIENEYGKQESDETATRRSEQLLSACRSQLPPGAEVLDYGGGDGRLMSGFAENGHTCYLIDYNPEPMSFVSKLGDTLTDLESDRRFQAIVANHVVEHLADPVATLTELRQHLTPDGFLFVEVPMEIWREPPLQCEPVTHLNFFVCESLARCLHAAGFAKVVTRQTSYVHPSGIKLTAVQAWARNGTQLNSRVSGYKRVQRHLNPRFLDRCRHLWSRRDDLNQIVQYKMFGNRDSK